MRKIIVLMLLVSALLLSGCATDRRSSTLETTLNAYGSAVRWGTFAQARGFLDPVYRKAHPMSHLDMARYKQVRVSEYDAGKGPVPVDKNTVRQAVRIDLINVHTQRERSIVDQQTWTYDAEKNHWWLESGLPNITPGH